jgi:putative sterol carrier protein
MYETVDEAFDNIQDQFNLATDTPRFYILQFDIEGWGKRFLFVKNGVLRLEIGEHHNPDLVIKAKEADYLDIVNGKVSLPTAYVTGLISFVGSVETVQRLTDFFPKVEDKHANLCETVQEL